MINTAMRERYRTGIEFRIGMVSMRNSIAIIPKIARIIARIAIPGSFPLDRPVIAGAGPMTANRDFGVFSPEFPKHSGDLIAVVVRDKANFFIAQPLFPSFRSLHEDA